MGRQAEALHRLPGDNERLNAEWEAGALVVYGGTSSPIIAGGSPGPFDEALANARPVEPPTHARVVDEIVKERTTSTSSDQTTTRGDCGDFDTSEPAPTEIWNRETGGIPSGNLVGTDDAGPEYGRDSDCRACNLVLDDCACETRDAWPASWTDCDTCARPVYATSRHRACDIASRGNQEDGP